MDSLTKLAQMDGKASDGKATITDYTKLSPAYSQPQVPNKVPMHSRTQPLTTSVKLPK